MSGNRPERPGKPAKQPDEHISAAKAGLRAGMRAGPGVPAPSPEPTGTGTPGPAGKIDREILARVRNHGRPARAQDLFPGSFVPSWAAEALARVWDQGHVTRDRDGRYALTESGERLALVGQQDAAKFLESEEAAGRRAKPW